MGPRSVLSKKEGRMRLKSFFAFALGILLGSSVLAQGCNQYTGPGSETFTGMVTSSVFFGNACTQANIETGSDLALDWIDNGQTDLINLSIFGAGGTFQYFDGSGGTNSSWIFDDVPGGSYTVNWLYSGNLGSEFTHVVGVYPPTVPVPEPSTYALTLVGLGIVGYTSMRRRKVIH